jgi:hypothetical protein
VEQNDEITIDAPPDAVFDAVLYKWLPATGFAVENVDRQARVVSAVLAKKGAAPSRFTITVRPSGSSSTVNTKYVLDTSGSGGATVGFFVKLKTKNKYAAEANKGIRLHCADIVR